MLRRDAARCPRGRRCGRRAGSPPPAAGAPRRPATAGVTSSAGSESRIRASRSRIAAGGSRPNSSRRMLRNVAIRRSASGDRPLRCRATAEFVPWPLAQRMLRDERFQIGDDRAVLAELEAGRQHFLASDRPQLLEARHVAARPLAIGELRVRRPGEAGEGTFVRLDHGGRCNARAGGELSAPRTATRRPPTARSPASIRAGGRRSGRRDAAACAGG